MDRLWQPRGQGPEDGLEIAESSAATSCSVGLLCRERVEVDVRLS